MVRTDQHPVERLEERPRLKVMLLRDCEYRVLKIVLVVAGIDDTCQFKNSLALSVLDLHDTCRYRIDILCPIDSLLKPVLKALIVSVDLIAVAGQPLQDEFLLLALGGYFDQVHQQVVRNVSSGGSWWRQVPDVFVQSSQPCQFLWVLHFLAPKV